MNTQAFLTAYNASRNGTDKFHYNPLYRKFLYSDGVKECAEAGCYWLLDILGTELPPEFKKRPDATTCMVKVTVVDSSAVIAGEFEDGDPNPYRREIEYTDMPEGEWCFYVVDEGDGNLRCILLTEY